MLEQYSILITNAIKDTPGWSLNAQTLMYCRSLFYNQPSQEIWMKSVTTKKPCFIKVLEMNLPAEILESLLAFHTLTGCDTTSQFTSFRKKTVWQVFEQYPHLLNKLGEHEIPSGATVSEVKEFVCRVYEAKSTTKSIQTVQCHMFRRLNKS